MRNKKIKISDEKRNILALVFFVTVFVYGSFAFLCHFLLKKDN